MLTGGVFFWALHFLVGKVALFGFKSLAKRVFSIGKHRAIQRASAQQRGELGNGNAKNLLGKNMVDAFCLSGIWVSKPLSRRLAISRKNTPLFDTGSKKVALGFRQSAAGSKSSISLANPGGVNTSSLLRFAKQERTSGL